jgi:hypothetical protein
MFDNLITYLATKGWKYLVREDSSTITFNLSGTNGYFYCAARDDKDLMRFSFVTWFIVPCPTEMINGMSQLLMRLNSTIFYGSFDLDFETGVINFKTSIFYDGIEINDTVLENVIIKNVYIMDECTPIILKFIYGGISPIDGVNIRRSNLEMPLVAQIGYASKP